MGFDFTIPIYFILAFEILFLTVFSVLGYFMVRKIVRRMKKMKIGTQKKLDSGSKTGETKGTAFA